MFSAICVVYWEECSAVCADGQCVACAVIRGTVTLVPYSIHFGQVTLKGNVKKNENTNEYINIPVRTKQN